MTPQPSHSLRERSPSSAILIIIGFVLIGMVIGNLLAAVVMLTVGGIGSDSLSDINGALMESSSGWLALMLGQAIAALCTFVFSGLLYWKLIENKKFSDLSFRALPPAAVFLFVIVIQVFFMPFNGWLQAINQSMQLPASLKGIEDFMRNMEDSLSGMTKFLTTFNSVGELILAFLVIAVIAGVGEELIFRGLIQRKLYLATKNPHVAIWVAAFIFSAIHFQFYGFLPRLMLGAMFGYFYYFTGNIWIPIVAHIFNNGLAVMLLFLSNQEMIGKDIEEMDNVPFPAAVTSVILAIGLLWYFKEYTSDKRAI